MTISHVPPQGLFTGIAGVLRKMDAQLQGQRLMADIPDANPDGSDIVSLDQFAALSGINRKMAPHMVLQHKELATDEMVKAAQWELMQEKAANADKGAFDGIYIMARPTEADAIRLAEPNGDVPEDLHITLGFLQAKAADLNREEQEELRIALSAAWYPSHGIVAPAFAYAKFNPTGANDRDPADVLLVQSDELAMYRAQLVDILNRGMGTGDQNYKWLLDMTFPIWIPHVTIGYKMDGVDMASKIGSITFDQIVIAFGDDKQRIAGRGGMQRDGGRPEDIKQDDNRDEGVGPADFRKLIVRPGPDRIREEKARRPRRVASAAGAARFDQEVGEIIVPDVHVPVPRTRQPKPETTAPRTRASRARSAPAAPDPASPAPKRTTRASTASSGPSVRRVENWMGETNEEMLARHMRPATAADRKQKWSGKPIPPAWTDVYVANSPEFYIQVQAKDSLGRTVGHKHADWEQQQLQAKFERIARLAKVVKKLDKKLTRQAVVEDDTAAVVYLMRHFGVRVDSGGKGEKVKDYTAIGATSIERDHVTVTPGGIVKIRFTGKSKSENTYVSKDPVMAELFRTRMEGKRPHDKLFPDTNSDRTKKLIKETCGDEFINHDLRGLKATSMAITMAQDFLEKYEPPSTEKEFKVWESEILTAVADQLNDTKAQVRKSYIDPSVWVALRMNLEDSE